MTDDRNDIEYEIGSGNIFADLGIADPETAKLKAKLAYEIARLIDERGLSQEEAAELLGTQQPKVSNIRRGRLKDISVSRLMTYLHRLDRDVYIAIREKPKSRPHGVTLVAGPAPPALHPDRMIAEAGPDRSGFRAIGSPISRGGLRTPSGRGEGKEKGKSTPSKRKSVSPTRKRP